MHGAESTTAIGWAPRRAIPRGRKGLGARARASMRRRFLALALVTLNLAATGNARSEDLGDCNQRVPPVIRMEACTRFIHSGNQSNVLLGMAYLYPCHGV